MTAANLSAVSGPTAGTDFITSGVAQLAANLQEIANKLCGARIHVRKLTDVGDTAAAKPGWTMTAGKPAGRPSRSARRRSPPRGWPPPTSSRSTRSLAGAANITVAETSQAGYTPVASHARRTASPPPRGGATTQTIASLQRNEDWYCTFRNQLLRATVEIEKQTQTSTRQSSALFTFTPSANLALTCFQLPATNMVSQITNVLPNTGVNDPAYTVQEVFAAGYRNQSLNCSNQASSTNTSTRTATIRVAAGETVRCVWVNVKLAGSLAMVKDGTTLAHHGDQVSFDFRVNQTMATRRCTTSA